MCRRLTLVRHAGPSPRPCPRPRAAPLGGRGGRGGCRRSCRSERVQRLRAAGSATAAGSVARGPLQPAARGHQPPAKLGPSRGRPATAELALATGRKLPDQQPETLRFFVARSTASGSVACGLGRSVHGDDDARRTVSLAEVARPRVQPPFSSRQRAAATTATTTSRHPARATRTRAPQLAAALAGSQRTTAESPSLAVLVASEELNAAVRACAGRI